MAKKPHSGHDLFWSSEHDHDVFLVLAPMTKKNRQPLQKQNTCETKNSILHLFFWLFGPFETNQNGQLKVVTTSIAKF